MGCPVLGRFPSHSCFLPEKPQNQAAQHPNYTKFPQSKTRSSTQPGRAEGFCYVPTLLARNAGEIPQLVPQQLCSLLSCAWKHLHK